ncbi:MAG TPA: hypothetical protein P5121_02920 [Caldilineaceae bacterium]|nr:hypothetical protein [Caldilineaceae bacterium]
MFSVTSNKGKSRTRVNLKQEQYVNVSRKEPAMTRNRQIKLQLVQYGAIFSALVTAFIHIYLSFQFAESPDPIFLSNGIGYLVLVVLLYAPIAQLANYQGMLRWIFIGYAALTIVLWVFWGARTAVGYIDKLVEAALIAFLWLDGQRRT